MLIDLVSMENSTEISQKFQNRIIFGSSNSILKYLSEEHTNINLKNMYTFLMTDFYKSITETTQIR